MDVAKGLQHIHESGVIHRDIKPSNIVLTEKGESKIADFGLACTINQGYSGCHGLVGTKEYADPDAIKYPHRYTPKTDVYAFAIVLNIMLSGNFPFVISKSIDILVAKLTNSLKMSPTKKATEPMRTLLSQCLKFHAKNRPEDAEVIATPDSVNQSELAIRRN